MTRVEVWMDNRQHPANPFQWTLAPEVLESFAEQAPGLPVTYNYDKTKLLGSVVEARVKDDGVELVLELSDDFDMSGYSVGPGFVTDLSEDAEDRSTIKKARLCEIGVIPAVETRSESQSLADADQQSARALAMRLAGEEDR